MDDKILVTGGTGLLGGDLVTYFTDKYDLISAGSRDFDIRDRKNTIEFITSKKPDIVIHAAAMADVNACQTDESLAMAINADGAGNVAMACRDIGARLVFISTDYVFNGEKETPYVEDDLPDPVNIYGESKLAGERHVADILPDAVILRVAWLYGSAPNSFIQRLIRLGKEHQEARIKGLITEPFRMVEDQIGTPTWTLEAARQIELILEKELTGLIHCTAGGACSRYELARLVFSLLNMDIEVEPCHRADFPDQAPRPPYTPLENARLARANCDIMRDYGTALIEFVKSL